MVEHGLLKTIAHTCGLALTALILDHIVLLIYVQNTLNECLTTNESKMGEIVFLGKLGIKEREAL